MIWSLTHCLLSATESHMLQDVRCRDEDTNVGPALIEFLDWSL